MGEMWWVDEEERPDPPGTPKASAAVASRPRKAPKAVRAVEPPPADDDFLQELSEIIAVVESNTTQIASNLADLESKYTHLDNRLTNMSAQLDLMGNKLDAMGKMVRVMVDALKE